jgi:hypothetical protein
MQGTKKSVNERKGGKRYSKGRLLQAKFINRTTKELSAADGNFGGKK